MSRVNRAGELPVAIGSSIGADKAAGACSVPASFHPVLELDGVTFSYEGAAAPSISDVTLDVAPGECVVLTGASGCGKTTVARVANGLACDFYEGALSGHVRIGGRDATGLPSWERAALVGSVFQNPRTQFFNLDTTGEVVFGMENLGVPRAEMHDRYGQVVDDLGVQALMGRDIFRLSGGQKQAIAFASAWANAPALYVLDEPSSNLDPQAMGRLAEFIAAAKRDGAAVLVAEHRLFWLAGVADRYICMYEGRIVGRWDAEAFARLDDAQREALGMRSQVQPSFAHLEAPAVPGGASSGTVAPACEARGLCAGYGTRPVLDGVCLALAPGEVVGIVGENGRGKTTLLRCLCGLHRESSGEVRFAGEPVPAAKRSSRAFLVMQDADYQLFRTSVRAELEAAARRGVRGSHEVDELLERLGLSGFADRHPASLSGGQKQRVVCAMAALSPAQVVLLDEPTSGLDFTNMARLAALLRAFAAQGKAVAVVSHDAEFVSRTCDRVVRL